jgi:hypothetical protein
LYDSAALFITDISKQYSKFMQAEESDGSIARAYSCMIAGSQF